LAASVDIGPTVGIITLAVSASNDAHEDEPLIAIDVAHALEREGAVVHFARDLEPALRMADYPSLAAGIVDLRLAGRECRDCV